jgi:hypothetical protein
MSVFELSFQEAIHTKRYIHFPFVHCVPNNVSLLHLNSDNSI